MDAKTIIDSAVKFILGEPCNIPDTNDDRYFLGDIIIRIANMIQKYGRPTVEMFNMSIEIGELTRDDCQNGFITLTSHDQFGRRDGDSLTLTTYYIYAADIQNLSEFGHTFSFDVCQACPTFISAICKVHDAGFLPDIIMERAKDYWIQTFGFWE